jgi:hypothetical protein
MIVKATLQINVLTVRLFVITTSPLSKQHRCLYHLGQHNQPGGYRENRNERGGNDHRGYGGNDHRGYGGNRNAPSEPSLTVVVKGLPVHTTENTVLLNDNIFYGKFQTNFVFIPTKFWMIGFLCAAVAFLPFNSLQWYSVACLVASFISSFLSPRNTIDYATSTISCYYSSSRYDIYVAILSSFLLSLTASKDFITHSAIG